MTRNTSTLWRGFWQLADPKIWIASTVPMFFSAAMAYRDHGIFDLYWFAISLLAIYLIETGKNAINEYVDYKTGVDRFVTPENRTPFSGGKKTIVDGLLTTSQVKSIAVITMTMAAILGVYTVIVREPAIVWLGAGGFLIAAIYSLPPFKLAYRGLGEMMVGLVYGPLIVCGTYLVQVHTLGVKPVIASLSLGFLIANVLIINEFPDYEADLRGQKLNIVVRLGRRKSLKIYKSLYVAAYMSIGLLILTTRELKWATAFISIPWAWTSVEVAEKYYDDIPRLVKANAKTITTYQLTGLGLSVAALFL